MLILAGCAANAAISFAHTAAIEAGGENRYKAVRLTPQIYNASNSDLSDLSIKDGNGENVPYFINTGFEMAYSDREAYPLEQTHFIESFEPVFTVRSGGKRTNIVIEGLKNLRLCDISIHTDSMFKRNVYTAHGIGKELYNISLDGASYVDTTIPMGWSIPQEEAYSITIDDGDDKPISVSRVTVRYYADDLVFEGNAGHSYTLEFSGDPEKTAPVYDIGRYKGDILKGTIDRAAIGEIRYMYEPEEIQPGRDYRTVFNIVVIIVALLLGTVIVMRLRKR
ncbi:MAG: hypothetical protein LBH39_01275 [Clostridiales Family XIII bacterium]|nr:hypothetical protein [Clostridiales Family XIII bacterium]